ncbi:hypothetical protein ACQRXC_28860 (plasmid) [Niallia taxi]|uniref:hypothetical protein n=1 Tax=Niallia taxi TaxID=2499688 RepID=UPI003F619D48
MFSNKKSYEAIKVNQILTIEKQINAYSKLTEIYHDRILVIGQHMFTLPLSYHRKKTPAHSYLSSVKNFIQTNPITTAKDSLALKQFIYIDIWVLNNLNYYSAAFINDSSKKIQTYSILNNPTNNKNNETKEKPDQRKLSGVIR